MIPRSKGELWFFMSGYLLCIIGGIGMAMHALQNLDESKALGGMILGGIFLAPGLFGPIYYSLTGVIPHSNDPLVANEP